MEPQAGTQTRWRLRDGRYRRVRIVVSLFITHGCLHPKPTPGEGNPDGILSSLGQGRLTSLAATRGWVIAAVICVSALAIGATVVLLLSSTPDSGVRGWLTYEGEPGGPTGYLRPGSIVAYPGDGSEAAAASFQEGESFILHLSPGRYRLQPSSGDARCWELTVDVQPDEFVVTPITCGVL